MSTLMPSTPRSTASATSSSTVLCHGGAAGALALGSGESEEAGGGPMRPKNRPFFVAPKLVNTSSTRAPRSWASRISRRPMSPVIRR